MAWTPQTTTLADCHLLLAGRGNLAAVSVKAAGLATAAYSDLAAAPGEAEGAALANQGLTEDPGDATGLALSHLAYDSRSVKPGTLFFCKGAHFKPEYLADAVNAGAVAYVSETDYTDFLEGVGMKAVPALLVHKIRPALADIAAFFYRGLLDGLTLIGLTGTKGKSSTTYMVRAILDSWLREQGKTESAWLSSIENYDGAQLTRSSLTTQDVLELYTHFRNAVDSSVEYLTMEVSSQALKYGRTRNLWFKVAGFLNIGEDHISPIEHPHYEDYLSSKLEIFKQCRIAVVNRETDELDRICKAAENAETCLTVGLSSGVAKVHRGSDGPGRALEADESPEAHPSPGLSSEADLVASDVASTAQGLRFSVRSKDWLETFNLPLAGRFNVENALVALAVAQALGVPVANMKDGLARCEVKGRMQLIPGPDGKIIIVDYAHNKMSFETIFATMASEYPGRPIVCVFGATGTKGLERRRDLPEVAVRYAEKIYITEDDPGEEPLDQINRQIAEVIEAAGGTYTIIEDRDEAISQAIWDSPTGSVVLVLGKGHETLMRRGREAVPVPSDTERVRRILRTGT